MICKSILFLVNDCGEHLFAAVKEEIYYSYSPIKMGQSLANVRHLESDFDVSVNV